MSNYQDNYKTHTILQPKDCKCNRERSYCSICDGGLSYCVICHGGEIELEEQTCEERLKSRRNKAIDLIAKSNYESLDSIITIFHLYSDNDKENDPIVMLVIDKQTVEMGVWPLSFPPIEKFLNYSTTFIDLSPNEFEMLKQNKLCLPYGLKIGREITREHANNS